MKSAEQSYCPLPEQLGFSEIQTTVSVWRENFPGGGWWSGWSGGAGSSAPHYQPERIATLSRRRSLRERSLAEGQWPMLRLLFYLYTCNINTISTDLLLLLAVNSKGGFHMFRESPVLVVCLVNHWPRDQVMVVRPITERGELGQSWKEGS